MEFILNTEPVVRQTERMDLYGER